MKSIIALLVVSTFLWGCDKTENHNHYYQNPDVAAKPKIQDSIVISSNNQIGYAGNQIIIKKSALEKEFLLRSQLIEQTNAPSFNGLKSRVVAFKLKGNQVYMLEATQGHTVSHDFPLNLVIAGFPTNDLGDSLMIDFAAGMSKIYSQADWRGADFDGKEYKNEFEAVPVLTSFIEEASFTKNNELVIRQVAQVPGDDGNAAVEARYYLSPYRANPDFKIVKSEGFDWSGYFEVAPYLKDGGESLNLASKFDENKTIEFAVSANTPSEYVQAVKDGVLYWNKAFGKEIIKVSVAPAGVSAPNAEYNIVQWVNWDNAGFAYADAQMDPRTGETLNAQVYFTSAFAFSGKVRARRILRKIKEAEAQSHKLHGLQGFEPSARCYLGANSQLVHSLESLLANPELSEDSKILKASQDYIREVVAHEVGHTLGLRHNFAGSLAANHTLGEREGHFAHYFHSGSVDSNVVTSSSVMEYQVFEESAMTGDFIAKSLKSLEYDEKVIQSLYLGQIYANADRPFFCTDSHTDSFADCTRFDLGSNLVDYVKYETERIIRELPATFIESFITAKTPGFNRQPKSVEEVAYNPLAIAEELIELREPLLKVIGAKQKLISVHRLYPVVDPVNAEAVHNAELDKVVEGLVANGGFSEVLKPLHGHLAEQLTAKLESLLASGDYDSGPGYSGEEFHLTADEKAFILEKGRKGFELLAKTLLEKQVEQNADLEGNGKLPKHEVSNLFASYLMNQASHYLLKVTGQTIEVKTKVKKDDVEKEVILHLPVFKYAQDIKKAAIKALSSDRAVDQPRWGVAETTKLKADLEALIKESLGEEVKLSDIQEEGLSDEAAQWLADVKALLEQLS